MEELINNLNNWTLIKIFGGIGIVLSGLIIYLSKLVNEGILIKWQENSNQRLEEMKGLINKNNSIVNTLTQQIGQSFQKILDKRIEATELYWNKILEKKISNSFHCSLMLPSFIGFRIE